MIDINDVLQLISERRTELKEDLITMIKAKPIGNLKASDFDWFNYKDEELVKFKTAIINFANATE
jgi:hypothetical protein